MNTIEENEFDFRAMFAEMRATLNQYEEVIKGLKDQVNQMCQKKDFKNEPSIPEPAPQPVDANAPKKRDSFDKTVKQEAIEMVFYLMDTTHLSKHKSAKQVAQLMDIKPRTVYAWMKRLKQGTLNY